MNITSAHNSFSNWNLDVRNGIKDIVLEQVTATHTTRKQRTHNGLGKNWYGYESYKVAKSSLVICIVKLCWK